jgi:hypothetical protein
MKETPEEREARWQKYRADFARLVHEREAVQPGALIIADYFNEAIDLNLAVGHYIVDRYRKRRTANVVDIDFLPVTP